MRVPAFLQAWRAQILAQPPLIAPARQFVYPQQIAGEEDALARGALRALVQPASGGSFLAMFALGFTGPQLPTGLWACPREEELCAIAGGYAYLLNTSAPERANLLELRPVVEVLPLVDHGLLVFSGLHHLAAWGRNGLAWHTARLSWEGLRLAGVEGDELRGFGWNLHTDREVEFRIDLATGAHTGGGYSVGPGAEGAASPAGGS
ncbi:MAG: hypothetical protein NVSMB62_05800 [Acidobacteriaceae bacterium]